MDESLLLNYEKYLNLIISVKICRIVVMPLTFS